MRWSDGEAISVTLTGDWSNPSYKDVSHGTDTTYKVVTSYTPHAIVFHRPGFGDISLQYWYYPDRYTLMINPDPPDMATARHDRLPVQLTWSDGETIDITLTQEDGEVGYDPNSVYMGDDVSLNGYGTFLYRIYKSAVFKRPGHPMIMMRMYYDSEEGIYYRTTQNVHNLTLSEAWSDGETVSLDAYAEQGSSWIRVYPRYDEDSVSKGDDVTFTDVYDGGTRRNFIFSRPGYGDIFIECRGKYSYGIRCETFRNPDPGAIDGETPPMSHDVEGEWSDGEKFSVTIKAAADGSLSYDADSLTHGDDTETFTFDWARHGHLPNSSYIGFERPGFGYQSLQWWHDAERGVYYEINERADSRQIEVDWADGRAHL